MPWTAISILSNCMLVEMLTCDTPVTQIKMVADPQQIGGRGGARAGQTGAAGMLDMFGCGANFKR